MKEKTKRILVVVVKWRHRANGLLEFQLVFRVSSQNTWTDRPIGRLVGLLEEQLSFLTLFYLDWCRKHLPHYISLKWVLLGCNSTGQFFITSWRALNNFGRCLRLFHDWRQYWRRAKTAARWISCFGRAKLEKMAEDFTRYSKTK